jgi:Na+-driven multidrug efflux pump
MTQLGRALIICGAIMVLLGFALTYSERLPFRFGRLPLDFRFQRDNFSFYFPLGTSIVLSVIISVIFMAINRR